LVVSRRPQALQHGGIAACSAEDEDDRGQQTGPVEPLDDIHPGRRVGAAAPTVAPPRAAVTDPGEPDLVARDPDQLGVHLLLGIVHEQVEEPGPHHDVLPQRDRPVLLDDDGGVAAHLTQPLAELLGVAHCCREGHQPYGLRQVEDHLFPDGPAEAVRQVVHLVHDDVAQVLQRGGTGVQHVPEHLGRHDDDRCVTVEGVVSGEEPDPRGAVGAHQV
jgi:hypothetical protein